jgi:hypothetical protein
MSSVSVDTVDIVKPVLALLIGFLGRHANFWTKDSLKGLADVLFRFTKSLVFVQSIVESTSYTMHWAMPGSIMLFNIITLVGGWYLFAHVPWPNNVILTMSSTGLMGGSLISWSISYFGIIGMQYYVYQELYQVIHNFGVVFVFAFYYLKMNAPKKVERRTLTHTTEEEGRASAPENWSDLLYQFLHFPAIIAWIIAWPIYFILLSCHADIGDTMRAIFTFMSSGLDFYLMIFVGGSLTAADIIKQSNNIDMWTAYFFRYVAAFPIFLMFFYDVFPDVDILTKDLMMMFIFLPVPAPYVFYVLLFAPDEDPSVITSLSALTQITQIIIYVLMGFFYFSDMGETS